MEYLCGIDMVQVKRIQDILTADIGEAFKKRVYTEAECLYCESRGAGKFESFAGRFAVKEAFSKAIGSGIGKDVRFHEIEVVNDQRGKPFIRCIGKTKETLKAQKAGHIDVSITHTEENAAAVVIIGVK